MFQIFQLTLLPLLIVFDFLLEHLPEPAKAVDHLKKLASMLEEDLKVRSALEKLVDPKVTCKRALQSVVST